MADANKDKVIFIPKMIYPDALKRIEHLNKKIARYDGEPLELEILEETTRRARNPYLGFEYDEPVYRCVLRGGNTSVQGWVLVAKIEPIKNTGELLVKEVPGQTCPPDFPRNGMFCDHCQTNRRRNAVWVLRCDDPQNACYQQHQQVGRNCLEDFLGASPAQAMKRIKALFEFEQEFTQSVGSYRLAHVKKVTEVPIVEFLTLVHALIRHLGFVSRSSVKQGGSKSHCTADVAWRLCTRMNDEEVGRFVREHNIQFSPEDLEKTKQALDWIRSLDVEQSRDYHYFNNLQKTCCAEMVTYDAVGYVASLFFAYEKHKDQPKEDYAGPVDSVHEGVLTVKKIHHSIRWTVVVFEDSAGYCLVKFCKSCPDWAKKGNRIDVKYKITDNRVFQGECQSVIWFLNRPAQVES